MAPAGLAAVAAAKAKGSWDDLTLPLRPGDELRRPPTD